MKETLDYLVAKNKRQLEDFYEEDECYMAQSIMHKLEEYWNIIEQSTILSTLLDPCSKLITFVTYQEKQNQHLFFESLLQQENATLIENELERYLALPLIPEKNLLK
ncbi:17102_t:CDS:2, partial [Cetraspora pellucida]